MIRTHSQFLKRTENEGNMQFISRSKKAPLDD